MRPRTVAALVAAVALVGLALPWPGPVIGLLDRGGPTAVPTLPAEFADFSGLTAAAQDHPAGRAIALYDYGANDVLMTWQTLVAGADRDTYRQIPTTDGRLLAPDGTRVLLHPLGAPGLTLLDLTTGESRPVPTVPWSSNAGADLQLLAWSADGRYVAYAVPAPPPADGLAARSYLDGRPFEDLAILDLPAGTSNRYPAVGPVRGAVFDPSGHQLLVQGRDGGALVSIGGQVLRPVQLPDGADLAHHGAWSPDGSRVAVPDGPNRVGFVDIATGRPTGVDVPADLFLGWRTPFSLLVLGWVGDTDAIVEVSTVDGHRIGVLSTFSRNRSCQYGLGRCAPYQIQLATGLIGSVTVRLSAPDRGPEVVAAAIGTRLAGAVAAGLGAFVGALSMAPRRRRVPRPE
jgi:hypothetical protein